MRLKQFFEEDNAVSPVIGVILMVAITVILAAVIATFVLGLGEQVSDTAPQASFNFDYEEGPFSAAADKKDDFGTDNSTNNYDAKLTIQHSGGPNIPAERLSLAGATTGDVDFTEADPFSDGDDMTAGDRVEVWMNSTDTTSIIWTSEDGTQSATLSNYDGPNA